MPTEIQLWTKVVTAITEAAKSNWTPADTANSIVALFPSRADVLEECAQEMEKMQKIWGHSFDAAALCRRMATPPPTPNSTEPTMKGEIRPTGRELRLANAAISLLSLVDRDFVPPGVELSEPIFMKLDEIRAALDGYKAHMLKPRMKRHTLIVLGIRAMCIAASTGG